MGLLNSVTQGLLLALMCTHLSCFLQEATPLKNCWLNWYYGCLHASWDHVNCGVPDAALYLTTYIPMWREDGHSFKALSSHMYNLKFMFRFEPVMVMNIKITFFWGTSPWSLPQNYKHFILYYLWRKAADSSEMVVPSYQNAWCHISDNHNLKVWAIRHSWHVSEECYICLLFCILWLLKPY